MEEFSLTLAAASCKCVICESPLSVFPVFLYQGGSVCGRCTLPDQLIAFREKSYETIAQFTKFPCKYQSFGCSEETAPSQMKNHENFCKYRQYSCPMSSCPWTGELDYIYQHYTKAHETHLISTDNETRHFELNLINKYEESYFVQVENDSFILQTSFDEKEDNFYYSLYCINRYKTDNDFSYRLEFIKQFDGKVYSLSELPVNDHEYSSFDKATAPKVSVKDIIKELEDPLSVACAVKIVQNVGRERKLDLKDSRENWALNILECPVCQEFMVPPIFLCVVGHVICKTCRRMVKKCPECRSKFGNTRNFRLEEMTEYVEYPCKNPGCPVICKAGKLKEHETSCISNTYSCPIDKCKWSGLYAAVLDHVRNEHPEKTIQVPVITFAFTDLFEQFKICKKTHLEILFDFDHEFKILPACGQSFLVIFRYCSLNFRFCWLVQFIGPKEDAKKYHYELVFKDNSKSDNRVIIKRPCSPLIDYYDGIFDVEKEEVLVLSVDLLRPLIDGGDLVYSLKIFPVS